MGSSKRNVSSNPFAAPIEEGRAPPALAPKPLSIWIAQIVVGLQAPIGVLAIWHLIKSGTASLRSLCLYSLLILASVTIVLGVQGRRRWARIVLLLSLATMIVTSLVQQLRGTPQVHLAQDLLGVRPSEPRDSSFVTLLLWGSLTLWACFSKKARAYFGLESSR